MKTHAILKNGEVRFLQVRSSKYLAVSFTKTLPLLLSRSSLILLNYVVSKISTYVHMRGSHCTLHSFSFNHGFSYWVFLVRFLTRQHLTRIMDIKGKNSDDFLTNTKKRHSDELPTILRCGYRRPEFIGKLQFRRTWFLGLFRRTVGVGIYRRTSVVGIYRRTTFVGIFRRKWLLHNLGVELLLGCQLSKDSGILRTDSGILRKDSGVLLLQCPNPCIFVM
ncbi:hypothetical protein YC2023_115804 [Brassica napus]